MGSLESLEPEERVLGLLDLSEIQEGLEDRMLLEQDEIEKLEKIAKRMRYECFKMMAKAKAGHVGGSLSIIEILTVLYFRLMSRELDKFVLSKGHASPALYPILAELGYFPKEWLEHFCEDGWPLTRHAHRLSVPGIEVSAGALGQGFSMAIGMALEKKILKESGIVYCLLGDGECMEGQVYEAALFARAQKLDNLVAIVDDNRITLDDFRSKIMADMDLNKIWGGCQWKVFNCNGHSIPELISVFKKCNCVNDTPKAIIAHTIKGKCGVPEIENNPKWHHWNKKAPRKLIEDTLEKLKKEAEDE